MPRPKSGRGRSGRPACDARAVLAGIVWVLRTGARWKDLPKCFPSYQTCHRRFQQWVRCGVLNRIFKVLYSEVPRPQCRMLESSIDGTYVPAQRGGQCVGRCRSGRATKIMVVADAAGLPMAVTIADGSRHDVRLVEQTLDAAVTRFLSPLLIGDKAFDSRPLAESLWKDRQVTLIAPKRGGVRASRRSQDPRRMRRYRRRWKVERLIAWLKQFRRVLTRWESKAANFLGFLHLACSLILLRSLDAN